VTNTTISDNVAVNFPGGVEAVNFGSSAPRVRLTNCTVAGNMAGSQAGVVAVDQGGEADIELQNTLVANGDATPSISAINANAYVVSLGNNLTSDAGGGFLVGPNDQTNLAPRLMKLADYGGPTPTRYPKPGSPLIDAGNDAGTPKADQRGVARPVGAHVDIGAVEADGTVVFADGFDGS